MREPPDVLTVGHLDPHREHPTFNATNNQGMTALRTFFNTTSAAVTAGTCQPKPLQN